MVYIAPIQTVILRMVYEIGFTTLHNLEMAMERERETLHNFVMSSCSKISHIWTGEWHVSMWQHPLSHGTCHPRHFSHPKRTQPLALWSHVGHSWSTTPASCQSVRSSAEGQSEIMSENPITWILRNESSTWPEKSHKTHIKPESSTICQVNSVGDACSPQQFRGDAMGNYGMGPGNHDGNIWKKREFLC